MGVNGIYGLSGSGLDIESLVKMGMMKKQSQYDKMQQTEIQNTWIKEAYTDVYADLNKYKNSTLSTYKLQSNMNAMAATSSDAGVVTATANGAAASMVHQVEVTSVATNAYLQTNDGEKIKRNNTSEKETSTYLRDILYRNVSGTNNSDGSHSYTVTLADGSTKNVKGSDVAISLDVRDSIDSTAEPHTISYTYDELFQDDKTLNDFASAFSKSGANIQGSYDTTNDSFSLYNKTTGSKNVIAITANNAESSTLMNNLKLASYDGNTNTLGATIDFTPTTAMATTAESKALSTDMRSTSLKDVLGLSASLVNNNDGTHTITFTGADGTKTVLTDTLDNLKAATAFSMNLSDGTSNATLNFTYEDLFNMDGTGSIKANASLNDLADKINNAGLSITASYNESTDSFSMSNLSGQAILTGNDATGTAMADALNLQETAEAKQYAASASANVSSLSDLLGVSKVAVSRVGTSGSTYTLALQDSTGKNLASVNGNTSAFLNGTIADKTAFTFNVGDGDSATSISISYGDLVDFSVFSTTSSGKYLYYKKPGATSTSSVPDARDGAASISKNSSTNIENLADKINVSLADAGMSDSIRASFDAEDGFQIFNVSGDVVISGNDKLVANLGLSSVPATAVSKQVSSGITRKVATSTNDSLKDIMGFVASYSKNGDGSYTISLKDSEGQTKEFTGSSDELKAMTAFSLKVDDTKKSTDVGVTLAELFDFDSLTGASGTLDGNQSMNMSKLAEKMNAQSVSAGVTATASFDEATKKLTMYNAKGNVALSSSDAFGSKLVSRMELAETEASAQAKINTQAQGANAEVTIDGKHYDLTTNKQTVAGVTYTFVGKTAGTTAKVTVNQDTDKIVDYVKQFVDDYNTLLDSLNDKLAETRYSDYKPLSTTQEEEMTEKQIEKWNEKAKSGLLYHSATIRDLVSAMREAVYTKVDAVDSKYNTLSAIGVSTSTTKGHLTFDEDKLRAALAEDSDCVYQLFASDQDSSYIMGSTSKKPLNEYQKKDDFRNTGVANRLTNVMTKHMSVIADYAGKDKGTDDQSYLGKLITNMQTKMSTFKTMMSAYETQLFKRYDAMEVALSKLGTQLSYIVGSGQ